MGKKHEETIFFSSSKIVFAYLWEHTSTKHVNKYFECELVHLPDVLVHATEKALLKKKNVLSKSHVHGDMR